MLDFSVFYCYILLSSWDFCLIDYEKASGKFSCCMCDISCNLQIFADNHPAIPNFFPGEKYLHP